MKRRIIGIIILQILILSCLTPIYQNPEKTPIKVNQPIQEVEHQVIKNHSNVIDTSIYRDRPLEEIVKNVPINTLNRSDIETLVQFLVENETDPFIKVKNIHDWISVNIAYDTEGFFSGNISATDFNEVLTSGKSVCSGYAQLFKKMTEMAGFNTEIVSGDSKGYGFDPFQKREIDVNHAWNAVEIKDNWYLVDTTWDAGHVDGKDFVFDYSTGYLFLDPGYMIFSHFPEEPRWQLLDSPISYSEYTEIHPLTGEFFDYFEIGENDRSILQTDGELDIHFFE